MTCVGEQSNGVVPGADRVKTVMLLLSPRMHDGLRIVGPPEEVDEIHGRLPLFHRTQDAPDSGDPIGIGQGGDGCAVDVQQVSGGAASDRIDIRKPRSRRRPQCPDLDAGKRTIALQISGSEHSIDSVSVEFGQ